MSLRQTTLVKAEETKEIKSLIQQYKAVGIASLQKVRAAQLQELRRKLEKSVHLRVVKNTIVKRAIAEREGKPGIENLEEHLSGSNIFLFTNLNPFKLVILLEKSRVKTTAKAGDIAAFDVIIHAGNTGLPPGPIISQFTAVGLPTRIEAGSVWVSRDTLVAKKGDIITARLAGVLSKLGVKPVDVGLTMKAVYDEGLILTEEQLRLDLDEFRRSVEEAHAYAFNLSLKAVYPLPENIALLLQTAHHEAYKLALNAGTPTRDTITNLIRKAYTEMLSLSSRLATVSEKAVSVSSVQKS
ncbi:MAG: 50S ribosomal protein L10 [Candidatus Bathyarchaeota archaeon BA2]|nr:MAG: 50S ribosomal protein L10 [Candidatus Bathyarchaeota archaeon BA2]